MVLDATPEGRSKDWYPKLEYGGDGGLERYLTFRPADETLGGIVPVPWH